MKKLSIIIAAILFAAASSFAQVSFGDAGIFNQGWTFHLGDIENAEVPEFDDSRWTKTDLPHDWSVKQHLSPDLASCTGYLPGGIGWYRKSFSGSQITKDNVYVYFEGVYNRSKVYINGHLLGERPSGYASFMYDITPYVNRNGDNVIAVRADHSRYADSRFYTGSGIYRNVWLIQAGKTHFAQWGVGYNATDVSDRQATLNVDTAIEGLGAQKCRLLLELKDKDGNTVAKTTAAAAAKQTVSFKVRNPHRWDVKDPYLYTLEASILSGQKVLDKTSVNVGIRTLEFNPDKGFALNGRWIKVKGVCLHHDAGVLGAAVPDDVWERRLRNLQAIGTNAIRTSHNPQTPAFYDLCDKLGLLVMDEAFDEWEYAKKKWISGWNKGTPGFDGTDDFFNEWGERDLTDMVRRDRNHPSIFLWSIGNEVDYPNDPYSHPILDGNNFEFNQPMSGGYKPDAPSAMRIGMIAKKLAACVRAVDTSRPVTGALAGVVMSNQTEYPEAVDVVGYNYTESRYIKDHQTYPDRVIYGSENGTSYGSWKDVRDNEHIFGQFIWTGTDYLGESNAWPSRGFHTGMLDFGSFIKPTGHARAAMWCEEPVCYIGTGRGGQDTWNYEEGQTVPVVCYTNAARARILVNGVQVGETKEYDDKTGALNWMVPYKPGTIKAEAMDENGKVVAEYSIKTSLRPFALKVSSDRTEFSKAGSVAHVIVEVVDENGDFVNLADNEIRCTVQGPATLLGLEASNNSDMTDYTLNVRRAYQGRLLAYIQSNGESGEITVNFTSPLLKGCSIKLGK